MTTIPYIPGALTRCADCGLLLFHDGTCPNPTCPSNTPTEIVEAFTIRPPDPHCPLCHGTGTLPPLPFCWQCG